MSTTVPGLWIARHGQSAGNVAAAQAEEKGLETILLAERRDADVLLSPLGELQARALGSWFATQTASRPVHILTSPYRRARDTAAIVSQALAAPAVLTVDERLRERELGVFDRLTRLGWQQRHPEQAELRARLGKFYHRPPGGESWCDVILRIRGIASELQSLCEECSVLVVTHQVVVLCLRYVLERLDEDQLLGLDAASDVANCAVTSYALGATDKSGGAFHLLAFNDTTAIEAVRAPVTTAPDAPIAPR